LALMRGRGRVDDARRRRGDQPASMKETWHSANIAGDGPGRGTFKTGAGLWGAGVSRGRSSPNRNRIKPLRRAGPVPHPKSAFSIAVVYHGRPVSQGSAKSCREQAQQMLAIEGRLSTSIFVRLLERMPCGSPTIGLPLGALKQPQDIPGRRRLMRYGCIVD
jgi:hypothetical protein